MKEEREPVRDITKDDPVEASLKQLFVKSVGRARRGWRCLDEETLAAYLEGKLSDSQRARSDVHLSACDYCLGQLAFLTREEQKPPVEVPAHLLARVRMLAPAPSWLSPTWKWAMAASAAVVILAVSLTRQAPPATLPATSINPALPVAVAPAQTDRAVPPTAPSDAPSVRKNVIRPRLGLLVPVDGAELSVPIEFKWRPVARALFYDVRITRADGSLQWEAQSDLAHLRVAPEANLQAGATYYVLVVAHLANGGTEGSSATLFRVSARK